MTARLLDGRTLASRIEQDVRAEVGTFAAMRGRAPRLVVVLVGDLAASGSYVKSKAAAAARVGIESEVLRVPETCQTSDLVSLVRKTPACSRRGGRDSFPAPRPGCNAC